MDRNEEIRIINEELERNKDLQGCDGDTLTLLPAGKYRIIDPCHALSDENYEKLIESMHNDDVMGVFSNEKGQVVSFTTLYGDGMYDCDGHLIAVDSGMICIVSEDLVDKNYDCGFPVTVDRPFAVGRDENGTLVFGNYTIFTNDLQMDFGCEY